MPTLTPAEFFAARGFELHFRREGDLVWADLRSQRDPSLVVACYGRGFDETSAGLRAVERWRVEQAT